MNAEINFSSMVPVAETGFLVPGGQSADAGLCQGQSLFQMMLFQSLEQMSSKEIEGESDEVMQGEIAEELVDLSAILMKVSPKVQDKLSVEIPVKAVAEVPVKAVAEVPVQTVAEVPVKTVTELPVKMVTELPVKTITEAPEKALVEIPTKALEGMPLKAPKEANMKDPAVTTATKTTAEIPVQAPEGINVKPSTEMPKSMVESLTRLSPETPVKTSVEMPPKAMAKIPVKASAEMQVKDEVENRNSVFVHRKRGAEVAEKEQPYQASQAVQDTEIRASFTKAVEKTEPYNQIGREIQLKLEQKGPMEFTMQLEPKDLGQIDIKLKVNEGKLVIDIIAVSSKTQALLAGQVDKLITSMGLQHVEVETVQVELENGERHSNFQQQSESRKQEQNFSGNHYRGDGRGQTESSPEELIRKNNFTRFDYTI